MEEPRDESGYPGIQGLDAIANRRRERIIYTYAVATKIEPGVAICNAGYAHCPYGDDNHYHCAKCGGMTGMMGHYAGPGKPFSCQADGVKLVRVDH